MVNRALQQFETYHDGEVFKLHQFEIMQLANLMQADSEVEEVRVWSLCFLSLENDTIKYAQKWVSQDPARV